MILPPAMVARSGRGSPGKRQCASQNCRVRTSTDRPQGSSARSRERKRKWCQGGITENVEEICSRMWVPAEISTIPFGPNAETSHRSRNRGAALRITAMCPSALEPSEIKGDSGLITLAAAR